MFKYVRARQVGNQRLRALPEATRRVNASRLAWQTSIIRLKAAA